MARATLIGFIVTFWVALFSLFWATNSISHEGGLNSPAGGFSERSKQHLAEIHIDLYEVVFLARLLSEVPFEITDGLRTIEEQRDYFNNGFSKTMRSKHLDGLAVDVVPIPVTWEPEAFYPIAEAMKQAADILDTPIVWGGDWRTFKDYPHFELKERPDGH
jgi:peptidoglycan L-alanyl-D-glutamate endopeptidase CwlK